MKTKSLSAQLEALLSAKPEPTSLTELAEVTDADQEEIQQAISRLKNDLDDRGLSLIQHDNKVQIVTDPGYSEAIAKQEEQEVDTNLTKAQSEALAVIAYMAPVVKSAIDFVRGVNSRAVLRNLATRGLITKDRSKDRVTFSLSSEALQHLGITSPQELPKYEQTRSRLSEFIDTNETD